MSKIYILSPAHPLRGGIAASSERLAQALQEAGHEVEMISFSLQYPNFLFPGKTQFTNDPAPANLKIRTLLHSINPLNWWSVGQLLRRELPDLIIVRYWLPFMGPSLGTVLRIAKWNKHTKVIALTDNIIPHEKRPGDRLFTQYFVKAIDGFISMSASVAKGIRTFTMAKPIQETVHPIYDNYGALVSRAEALTKLDLPKGGRYLLFFGFIRAYKGLDLLLKAFAKSEVRKLGLKLIVAGEFYSNEEEYQQLIDELGIREALILHTHFISNDEVKYYFGAADLLVQPYRTATQSGISQMAYHFEKPMIVTKVGGLPEIVPDGEAGYVVEVDENAIAAGIVRFFEEEKVAEMTKVVMERKALFSWAAMVRVVEGLYEKISIK
ncbi:MAG: glycosyltransferase [Saprospiraceae bacterium]|nr:glycosyltransferase [Saprospiraceae bacterium]